MKDNISIILIIGILIAVIVWWYGEDLFLKEEKAKVIKQQYSFGSLDPNLTGQTIAPGCTDPAAFNYSENAEQDDGTCIYKFGCCDINATNYEPAADSCHLEENNLLCDYGAGVGNIPNQWTPEQWQGCIAGQEKAFGSCDIWCQLIMMRLLTWENLKSGHCWVDLYVNGWGSCPALCENGTPADDPNYDPPVVPLNHTPLSMAIDPEGCDFEECS